MMGGMEMMCKVEGCEKSLRSNNATGYCKPHYRTSPENKQKARDRAAARYAADPQTMRDRALKYREENREKLLADRRAWYAINRVKVNEAKAAGRNREADREYAARRRVAQADKIRSSNAGRRALRAAAFVEEVSISRVYARTGGQCHLCLRPIDFNEGWHQDHVVPLSRGGLHAYGNLAPAHAFCNMSKKDKLDNLSSIPWVESTALEVCTA